MSASYSNAKVISDLNAFSYYIKKTYATLTQIQNNDGVNVVCTFSAALTAPQQTALTALVAAYVDPLTGNSDAVNVSVYNSSAAALGVSAVFTGTWEDVSRYSHVYVSSLSNQASAASGISIQFGNLAGQADLTKTYSAVASVQISVSLPVTGRFFRIVYTNGTTLQTSFALQTKFLTTAGFTVVDAASTIDDTTPGILSRNLNMGRYDVGTYVSVRADENKVLRIRPIAINGLDSLVKTRPIAQADFIYNLDTDLATTTLVTSGAVTYVTGTVTVATAALASSSAILTTRRYVNPGYGGSAVVVASASFTTGVANNNQLVGWGSIDNGLFVGYNGISFGIMYRSATVDTWVAKTAWGIDKLDGTGPSGIVLDPTKGNVYVIIYDGSGFGSASFGILPTSASNAGDAVIVHRVLFGNALTTTGLRNPQGPLYAQSINTTNATAITVKLAGFAAYGSVLIGKNRSVDSERTISTMTSTPIMSVFQKTTHATLNNYSSFTLRTLSVSTDGTKGSVVIQLIDGATLTNSSYADVSTTTSAAQLDTSATSYTGGAVLFSCTIHNTANTILDLTPYDIRVSPGMTLTASAKCTTSGTSTSVAACLTFSEFT
jgi:hypothetical protein